MTGQKMTYDELLVALGDIVASEAHVNVFIAGRSGSMLLGLGGRLRRAENAFVEDEWAPVYIAHGGDEDFAAFYVDGGQDDDACPCFAVCEGLLQTVEAVGPDDLQGPGGGTYWRGLTIGVDGVIINIGVMPASGED